MAENSRWHPITARLPKIFLFLTVLLFATGAAIMAFPSARHTNQSLPKDTDSSISLKNDENAQKRLYELHQEEQEIIRRESLLKDEMDTLKWILGLILSASVLFTIAQGAATHYSAKDFMQQAHDSFVKFGANSDKAIDAAILRIKEIARGQAKYFLDFKKQVSSFTYLEMMLKEADENQGHLEKALQQASPIHDANEGFDWRRRLYQDTSIEIRQRILTIEQFFPYTIRGRNDRPKRRENTLRYLAQFYWAKFAYDKIFGYGNLGRVNTI